MSNIRSIVMKKTTSICIIVFLAVIALSPVFANDAISTHGIELTPEEARDLILGNWIETHRISREGHLIETHRFIDGEVLWRYNEDGSGIQEFTHKNDTVRIPIVWDIFEEDGKLWIETSGEGEDVIFIDELVFFHVNHHIALDTIGGFIETLLDDTEVEVVGWMYERAND